jgi:hypothetical protein
MESQVKKQVGEVRKGIAMYKKARKAALTTDPYDEDHSVHLLALALGGVIVVEETEKLLELLK